MMEYIFQILLKSTICITVCYFFYFLLLRNETWHTLNRIYLILGILFSHLIPFMKITVYQEAPEIISRMVPVALPVNIQLYPTSEATETGLTLQPFQILGIVYITGIVVMVLRFVVSTCQVLKIIYRSEKVLVNGIKVALYPNALIPFSFFQYLVIGKNDYERDHKRFVLAHEQKHIRQFHWVDMLIMEMIMILHWYNPFVWLVKRSLKNVHEFLADEGVLKHGYGTLEYQKVLLKNTVGEIRYTMAKSFYQSKLKKRLAMMKKNRSTSISRLRLIAFLPIISFLFYAFAEREVIWEQRSPGQLIMTSEVQDTIIHWTEDEFSKWPQKQMVDSINPPTIYPIKNEYLNGEMVGWGYRIHPIYKIKKFHEGVDFKAKKGAPVQTTASGLIEVVTFSRKGFGNCILVKHDKEFKTRYAHLSEIIVTVGEKVSKGQIIGYIGKTGSVEETFRDSTEVEAHLHYEVIKNNKRVDPKDYFPVVTGESESPIQIGLRIYSSQAQIGKKRSPILDSLANQRIEVNGELMRIEELEKLIETQEMDTNVVYPKIKAAIGWGTIAFEKSDKQEYYTMLCLPPIDPKDPAQFYVLNGKRIKGGFIRTDEIKRLELLSKDEAVKRFGSKAKYGAIVVVTKDPSHKGFSY